MKLDIITRMQRSSQVVHILRKRDADPLIEQKYLRVATITPAPSKSKVAVSLTILGRSLKVSETTEE